MKKEGKKWIKVNRVKIFSNSVEELEEIKEKLDLRHRPETWPVFIDPAPWKKNEKGEHYREYDWVLSYEG